MPTTGHQPAARPGASRPRPLLLLAAALLLAAPATSPALEIVYPADQTSIRHSDYLVIKGGSTPPLDGMTVELGGVKSDLIPISGPAYQAKFKDLLILQPEFDAGENRILVEGIQGGKVVAQARATVYLLGPQESAAPAPFRRFVMHTPEKEALCAGCHHKMNPTAAELDRSETARAVCGSCHRQLVTAKHVHGPAGVFECTYCHDPASKPARYQAKPGDAVLCSECHSDQFDRFRAQKFTHGPIEAGMCLVCHDPHASDQPAQALLPINDLCLGCHAGVGENGHVVRGISGKSHPLGGKPDPSRPGRTLDCTGCHNPHGGSHKSYFQREATSPMTLCRICHKK